MCEGVKQKNIMMLIMNIYLKIKVLYNLYKATTMVCASY